MKRTLQISNGIALVSTIFINYLSNTGLLNGKTIGGVSDKLITHFTPAGYAFSIWGFIYLLLIGFIFYQGRSFFTTSQKSDDAVLRIGWWFVLSCIANCAWIFLWLYGYTGMSCIAILILLFSLMQIIYNCRLELDYEPFSHILFVAWPFVFYAGWVTVASIANISAYLNTTSWNRFGFKDDHWAIAMIVVAIIVNIRAIYERNLREFALVGAWALIAIGVRNQEMYKNISDIAYLGAATLIINCGIHAYQQYRKSGNNLFFAFKIKK